MNHIWRLLLPGPMGIVSSPGVRPVMETQASGESPYPIVFRKTSRRTPVMYMQRATMFANPRYPAGMEKTVGLRWSRRTSADDSSERSTARKPYGNDAQVILVVTVYGGLIEERRRKSVSCRIRP